MERTVIKEMPKVELHCHLDGSIRPAVLRQIAKEQGQPLELSDAALKEQMSLSGKVEDLAEYLQRFDFVLPYLQTASALERVAYDFVAQMAEETIVYSEMRFSPAQFSEGGLTFDEVVAAVIAGIRQAEVDFHVKCGILLCAMRHHPLEENLKVVETAKKFIGKGVVGVDLAGDEARFPAELFKEMTERVHEYDLPLTLHAGETGSFQNVVSSIGLGARRIGHGIAIQQDEEAVELTLETETLLEVCPKCNWQTGAYSWNPIHPIQELAAEGVKVCVNTDNRTVSDTTLTDEFLLLEEWYGIDYDFIKETTMNAVDGAFIEEQEKERLRKLILEA